MSAEIEVVSLVRGELTEIISGTFFLLLGLIAFSTAAIRRWAGVRILIWLGLWSGMFGVNELVRSQAIAAALPPSLRSAIPLLIALIAYLMVVVGTLSFLELSLGKLRTVLLGLIAADLVVAVAGIYRFFASGVDDAFVLHNNLLAVITVTIVVAVAATPKLSQQYMVVSGHRVLTLGTIVFAAQALYANLANVMHWNNPAFVSSLGFAVLLGSFGYTAITMIVSNESRLLAIDKELEIARQLQFSILPGSAPEIPGLRISAAYEPMTAVAGDFYEFIKIDDQHIGFLVADVSGHGVPAALIASMIKVAAQSVSNCASDPGEVLRRLGSILSSHLCGQLVSAAYLWIDTASGTARYSAAGHPPLLHWRATDATLARIESNGLLFGVMPGCSYPVSDIPLTDGDRFLLYTDGVTEPENAAGEPFGDHKLEQIVRDNQSQNAAELSARLLAEVREWQSALLAQDDITLIAIDVVKLSRQVEAQEDQALSVSR
jgi:sigma-B regulation protein RsbU (phosphoserine phosphatase)